MDNRAAGQWKIYKKSGKIDFDFFTWVPQPPTSPVLRYAAPCGAFFFVFEKMVFGKGAGTYLEILAPRFHAWGSG